MNPEELDRLIHRYFERDLAPEEETLLAQLIRTDPAAADRFVELSEMESALVESLKAEEALPPEITRPVRTTRRRTQVLRAPEPRAVWPLLLAAALMIGFVVVLVMSADAPAPRQTALRVDPPIELPAPPPSVAPPPHVGPNRPAPARPVDDDFRPPVLDPRPVVLETPPTPPTPEPPRPEKRDPAPAEKPVVPSGVEVAGARIEKVEGDVVRLGDTPGPAAAGQALPSGQGLDARKGTAILALEDGSRIELRSGSRLDRLVLTKDKKRFELGKGAAAAVVTKQAPKTSVVFATPHAEVTVLGTRLSIEISNDSTRVEVEEGLVRCMRTSDRYTIDIPAGRFAIAKKGQAPVARPTTVTRGFQDGVSPTPDYQGTRDTWISSIESSRNFATADQLHLQRTNTGIETALLQWDVTSIPPGSKILSAELSFWVTGKLGGACKILPMKASWDETLATWKSAGPKSWQQAGAQGSADRGNKPVGLLEPGAPGAHTLLLNDLGVTLVQDWVNDPANRNFGILILGPDSNEWGVESRETARPERRPKLTVTYLPAK